MLEIRIAKPCDQTWTAMRGDDRVRHCGACRKNVYNIAAMTEAEVEALVRRTEGRFCARVYRRTDGRVLTADCPKGVAAVRRKRTLAVTGAFAAFAGVVYALPVMGSAGSRSARSHAIDGEPPLAGKVAIPEEPVGYTTGIVSQPIDRNPGGTAGKYDVQMGAPMIKRTK